MEIFKAIFIAGIIIAVKFLLGTQLLVTAECYLPCVITLFIGIVLRSLDVLVCRNGDDRKKLTGKGEYYFLLSVIILPIGFVSFFLLDILGGEDEGFACAVVIAISVVIMAIGTALICNKIRWVKQVLDKRSKDNQKTDEKD